MVEEVFSEDCEGISGEHVTPENSNFSEVIETLPTTSLIFSNATFVTGTTCIRATSAVVFPNTNLKADMLTTSKNSVIDFHYRPQTVSGRGITIVNTDKKGLTGVYFNIYIKKIRVFDNTQYWYIKADGTLSTNLADGADFITNGLFQQITIVCDDENHGYDIYVDTVKINATLLPYRLLASYGNKITLWNFASCYAGTYYIDDITIDGTFEWLGNYMGVTDPTSLYAGINKNAIRKVDGVG